MHPLAGVASTLPGAEGTRASWVEPTSSGSPSSTCGPQPIDETRNSKPSTTERTFMIPPVECCDGALQQPGGQFLCPLKPHDGCLCAATDRAPLAGRLEGSRLSPGRDTCCRREAV